MLLLLFLLLLLFSTPTATFWGVRRHLYFSCHTVNSFISAHTHAQAHTHTQEEDKVEADLLQLRTSYRSKNTEVPLSKAARQQGSGLGVEPRIPGEHNSKHQYQQARETEGGFNDAGTAVVVEGGQSELTYKARRMGTAPTSD